MGRALVREPKLFLFDEPLSNLDAKLRVTMRTEIKRIHQTTGASIVYVTHDQIEAMTLASRIVVMKDGVVQQIGTPAGDLQQAGKCLCRGLHGAPSMNLMTGTATREGDHLRLQIRRRKDRRWNCSDYGPGPETLSAGGTAKLTIGPSPGGDDGSWLAVRWHRRPQPAKRPIAFSTWSNRPAPIPMRSFTTWRNGSRCPAVSGCAGHRRTARPDRFRPFQDFLFRHCIG